MIDIMKQEDKKLMLQKMQEWGWTTETNEESPYEDVERDFNEMIQEIEAVEADMGIDYDF